MIKTTKNFHIRGSKEARQSKFNELIKNPLWEDAHRYATLDKIEQGLVGRVGDINYYNK